MSRCVLVVDDHPTNLKLACALLLAEGYQVLTASNADDVVSLLRHAAPDLILMDIALPGTDGLTLTRMLKAGTATKHIPVVALTASAMKGDDRKAFAARGLYHQADRHTAVSASDTTVPDSPDRLRVA
jgi:CheY-like chemotaxis protein